MLDLVDKDRDGSVDYNEFSNVLKGQDMGQGPTWSEDKAKPPAAASILKTAPAQAKTPPGSAAAAPAGEPAPPDIAVARAAH